MSGKGSNPRPFSVTQNEFAENFDRIFRKDKRIEEEHLQEDEEFARIAKVSEIKDSEQGG
jgi:hypothetical protein